MSKSIKLKNNTYWDSSSITHNKHSLDSKLEEKLINVSSIMSNKRWVKICNVKFDKHTQGEFIFFKILIGQGNNGTTYQNAYIDLIGQLSWVGENGGRLGCNAELHPFKTSFTTSNTQIKVIANNYLDYDIWLDLTLQVYCKPNYIANTSNRVTVTPSCDVSSSEPTGTSCNLSYTSV